MLFKNATLSRSLTLSTQAIVFPFAFTLHSGDRNRTRSARPSCMRTKRRTDVGPVPMSSSLDREMLLLSEARLQPQDENPCGVAIAYASQPSLIDVACARLGT